jgi:hypothetical protein
VVGLDQVHLVQTLRDHRQRQSHHLFGTCMQSLEN